MELRMMARYTNAGTKVNRTDGYDAPLARYELRRVIRAELARGKAGDTERSKTLQEHFRRLRLYGNN